MALIRNPSEPNDSVNYLATLAFFACVSCLAMMLKFGFRARINFSQRKNENDEITSMVGAYRINRDDFFDTEGVVETRKKLSPSMVQLPTSTQSKQPMRPTKSTSDLTMPNNVSAQGSKSTNDVSYDPRGAPATTSNRNTSVVDERKLNANKDNKQQTKLEKQRLAEQKAREKAAAKEQEKQDKLRKKREKEEQREQAKAAKENLKKKRQAPQPKAATPLANPTTSNPTNNIQTTSALPSNRAPTNTPARTQKDALPPNQAIPSKQYSSDTLQSSISRNSGPPPYSEATPNQDNNNSGGNVSFGKPIEEPSNSWDLISQHRQQMSRPAGQALKVPRKNVVMDLQYKLGNDDNSDV